MGSFVTDRTLGEDDLALLAKAQRGDRSALRAVCQRFQTPILAMAVQSSGSLAAAVRAVEPVLYDLLEQLLLGSVVAVDWPERVAAACAAISPGEGVDAEAEQGIAGMQLIPRVVRRRIVRDTLPKLPLPELTALLLKYVDRRSPAEMVGLVADTPHDAQRTLVAAHEQLQRAVDEQLARLEVSP